MAALFFRITSVDWIPVAALAVLISFILFIFHFALSLYKCLRTVRERKIQE